MINGHRNLLVAALAVLSLAAVSAVAYASNRTTPDPVPVDRPAELHAALREAAVKGGTTAVPAVEDAITRHFALFRNQEASPVPAHLVPMIASPDRFGRNAVLARKIATVHGTGWVIPGAGYVCLAVPGPVTYGVTCRPTELAVKEGLWGRFHGERLGDEVVETLVVPDGNKVLEQRPSGDVSQTLLPSEDGVISRVITGNDTTPVVTAR